jgi:hypothetical protein
VRTAFYAAMFACVSFGRVAHGQLCDPAWDHTVGNPGLGSTVWCVHAANQSSAVGPALYVGGQFSSAGGADANRIAAWDGTSWSPLGTGAQSSGTIYAIQADEAAGLLYVGGAFSNLGGMASTRSIGVWDGSSWSDVGGGNPQMSNAGVRTLALWDGDLYAGGYINQMGAATASKLARWDGATWSSLPGNPLGSTDYVEELGIYDDGGGEALYVGGTFSSAGGNGNARNIFRWDGAILSALGQGTNGEVEAMAVFDGELYVGGYFNEVYQSDGTAVTVNKIARWDGSSWSAVGSGMNSGSGYHVWTLAAFDDGNGEALYAGGSFTTAGGVSARRIARWDGTSWTAVSGDTDLNGYVYELAVFNDGTRSGLYSGGTFTSNDGQTAQRIAQWRSGRPDVPANVGAYPDEVCAGEWVTLSASATGVEIDWYADSCGGTYVGSGGIVIVFPASTTTYHARARDDSSGCESSGCQAVIVNVDEWCCDCPGDVDGSGVVDGDDIAGFLDCLFGSKADCGCIYTGGGAYPDPPDVASFVDAVLGVTTCPALDG